MLKRENRSVPRRVTYEKVLNLIEDVFKDKSKSISFWINKHPQLNNKSPFELVKEGKSKEVIKLISDFYIVDKKYLKNKL